MATATTFQPQIRVQVQIPVSATSQLFTVNSQKYEILRFDEGRGINLAQTRAMAESMKGRRMLTLKEADKIKEDSESNTAFRKALRPGNSGYLSDLESERRSWYPFLSYPIGDNPLTIGYGNPVGPHTALILKVTNEAAAQRENAKEFRRKEQK
jgi:hypothetical protein